MPVPKDFEIRDRDFFFSSFPKLNKSLRPSSPATEAYICFSLGVGDPFRIWAPENYCWWLPGIPRNRSVSSFKGLFRALGYTDSDEVYIRGVRKVAIYAVNGNVKHVAVQPPDKDGQWHSKMGSNVNIMHTLDELSGPEYGTPVSFMKENKPSRANRVLKTAQLRV